MGALPRIIAVEPVATGIRVATIDPISGSHNCRLIDCSIVDGFEGGRRSVQYEISPDSRSDYFTVVAPSRVRVHVHPRETGRAYQVAIHHALRETDGDTFALALPLPDDGYFGSDASAPDVDFLARLDSHLETPVGLVERGKVVQPPYRLASGFLHCFDLAVALLDWQTIVGSGGKLYPALEVPDLIAQKSCVAVVGIEWGFTRIAVFGPGWKLTERRQAIGLADAVTSANMDITDLASLNRADELILSGIREVILSDLEPHLQCDMLFVGDGAFMFAGSHKALPHQDDPRFASVRGAAKLKRHQMAENA